MISVTAVVHNKQGVVMVFWYNLVVVAGVCDSNAELIGIIYNAIFMFYFKRYN